MISLAFQIGRKMMNYSMKGVGAPVYPAGKIKQNPFHISHAKKMIIISVVIINMSITYEWKFL